MPWNIGNLELKKRVVQSPMIGYTDLVYRRIIRDYGAELAFAEMLSSEAFIREGRKSLELIRTAPDDTPTGAQIMGAKPDVMRDAAKSLEYHGFKLLDINAGCPARKIVSQGAGSALLKDARNFADVIRSVVKSIKIPVTIKLRIGTTNHDEDFFIELLKIAESEGVSAVTVHGRTQKQKYKGKSDPSPIRVAKENLSIPVIGNGDVVDGPSALELINQTKCDAIMIGRGSLGNPWIFSEIDAALNGKEPPAPPSYEDEINLLVRHVKDMAGLHGERLGMLKMRKMSCFYFNKSQSVIEFRKKAVHCSTVKEFLEAIDVLRSAY